MSENNLQKFIVLLDGVEVFQTEFVVTEGVEEKLFVDTLDTALRSAFKRLPYLSNSTSGEIFPSAKIAEKFSVIIPKDEITPYRVLFSVLGEVRLRESDFTAIKNYLVAYLQQNPTGCKYI